VRDYARRRGPGKLQTTEGLKRLVDEPRGLLLVEGELGVLMQVPAPPYDFIPDLLDQAADRCRLDDLPSF
jgi:hypothetical protein